jgi:hypothetical protein
MKNLLFTLLFFNLAVMAQDEIVPYGDALNTPLREKKYINVTGNPYLFNYWVKGTAKTKSGKTFINDSLKYDMVDDMPIFRGKDGALMKFSDQITEFEINNYRYINGLPKTEFNTELSYYQVIAIGKISLFKKTRKSITETKLYGSATADKSFTEANTYFVLKDQVLSKITPNKKNISTLFTGKESEMVNYLSKEKIDFKKDADLNKLFTYFNK